MNYRKTFNRINLIACSTIAVISVIFSIVPPKSEAQALFKPAVIYGVGDGPTTLAIGDLNGDDNPDLAAATGPQGVSILINRGGFAKLIYSPISPCRLIDTRKMSAGIIGILYTNRPKFSQKT